MSTPVQDPQTEATRNTVTRFNEAFNRHDVDAVMALMTDDCLFDSTRPPPDGERLMGQGRFASSGKSFSSARPTPASRRKKWSPRETGAWCAGLITGSETASRGVSAASICFACMKGEWLKSYRT
mgnify:CR=1 FL=1|jgi:SnoaL-like domain